MINEYLNLLEEKIENTKIKESFKQTEIEYYFYLKNEFNKIKKDYSIYSEIFIIDYINKYISYFNSLIPLNIISYDNYKTILERKQKIKNLLKHI